MCTCNMYMYMYMYTANLLCLIGGFKVSIMSSVVFISSLLSDDVSQVGLLQL